MIWTDIELYHLKNCPQLLDCAWSCAWIDLSATSYDCSIEVMSGEHGGHTIHWNSPECSLKQLWVTWAWWHSAFSCWNNPSLLEDMEFLWVDTNSHKAVQFCDHWSMMYLGENSPLWCYQQAIEYWDLWLHEVCILHKPYHQLEITGTMLHRTIPCSPNIMIPGEALWLVSWFSLVGFLLHGPIMVSGLKSICNETCHLLQDNIEKWNVLTIQKFH